MGLFGLFRKKENKDEDIPYQKLLEFQLKDDEERKKYVSASLLQMKEISSDVDSLRLEYNTITSFLNDCDEIEKLPAELKYPVEKAAKDIITIKENKEKYYLEKPLIDDDLFDKMDKIADDMPEAADKMYEAEDFQKKIKSDLKKLEGEKQAYYYRRNELNGLINNMSAFLVIATVFGPICVLILVILALTLDMDVKIGLVITAALVIAAYSYAIIKGMDLKNESRKLDKTIVRLIQLQNSVKIRFVNNTNLLDYLYMKYEVTSSNELKEDYELYLEERDRREQYEQASKDLQYAKKQLLMLLSDLPINDPLSWAHMPEAIIDKNEMVEVRHEMIGRRQKLRDQIEENTKNAQAIKDEIKEMIKRYPKYSVEIMSMLDDFEKEEDGLR